MFRSYGATAKAVGRLKNIVKLGNIVLNSLNSLKSLISLISRSFNLFRTSISQGSGAPWRLE